MTLEEIRNFFNNDRFAMGIGCHIDEAEPGRSVISLNVEDRHLNGNNVVQGGVMFTLADIACAVATCADGTISVSADGTISYFSAAKGKKLIAEATVLKKGRTLSYAEALITDETGKKIAKASFTMCRISG